MARPPLQDAEPDGLSLRAVCERVKRGLVFGGAPGKATSRDDKRRSLSSFARLDGRERPSPHTVCFTVCNVP